MGSNFFVESITSCEAQGKKRKDQEEKGSDEMLHGDIAA